VSASDLVEWNGRVKRGSAVCYGIAGFVDPVGHWHCRSTLRFAALL